MGINACYHHSPAVYGQTPLASRRHQSHQVGKGAAAGGHTATTRRQA